MLVEVENILPANLAKLPGTPAREMRLEDPARVLLRVLRLLGV
jgi:hypothetical protein